MAQLNKNTYYVIYDKDSQTYYGDNEILIYEYNTDIDYFLETNDANIEVSPPRGDLDVKRMQISFDGENLENGIYSFPVTLKNSDNSETINFNIEFTVFSSYLPPVVPPQSINPKYFLEYYNIENDFYRLEIWEKGFIGTSTEIHGNVSHGYEDRKDLMQSVVSSNLDINLEADQALTLQDLYTEDEGKFSVKFFRNQSLIFTGILKPDGVIEDFVSDKWEISMDAMDGLNILKDLQFVKDNGTFYSGKISQFEAVKQCLHRIGYDLPINISVYFKYEGLSGTGSVLQYTYMNADRFYQDKETNKVMSCEEVLKSVLDIYNATIIQMNGEWWIFRSIDLKEDTIFIRYVGSFMTGGQPWQPIKNLGSDVDGFDLHHIEGNQKRSINPSAQTFRCNYQYGTVKAISRNPNLELTTGLNCDGWLINIGNYNYIVRRPEGSGFAVTIPVTTDIPLIQSNQAINIIIQDQIDVTFNFNHVDVGLNFPYQRQQLKIKYQFVTPNFILSENGWIPKPGNETTTVLRVYPPDVTLISETISLPPSPESGNLGVFMILNFMKNYTPNSLPAPSPRLEVYSIQITPNRQNNYKGEMHIAERKNRISSTTKKDKTVKNGDSISDIYLGTLYDDNMQPTTGWRRSLDFLNPFVDILKFMVVDTLKIAPRPMFQFEGSIYGYMPYLSVVLINNISGRYQFEKYSFNTNSNINRASLREFDNANLVEGTDYTYSKSIDYGKEVKVLINP